MSIIEVKGSLFDVPEGSILVRKSKSPSKVREQRNNDHLLTNSSRCMQLSRILGQRHCARIQEEGKLVSLSIFWKDSSY